MKGQTKVYWLIGLLAIILITVIIFLKEFQMIFNEILNIVGKTSSDIVSRQLSNLITISGAAPNSIEIVYTPSKSILYDVTVKSRILTIKQKSGPEYLIRLSASHPFAVDLPDKTYEDVNTFKVVKKVVNGGSVYELYAIKE